MLRQETFRTIMDEATDEQIETGIDGERTSDIGRRRERAGQDPGLDAVVVRYRSGRDRCTLVPRDGPPESMLTAWLSTDLEAVVDLEDAR